MCVPACQEKIVQTISRRNFLKTAGVAAVALATGCRSAANEPAASTLTSFSQVIDLTHTLTTDFPTYGGEPQLELETLFTLANGGYNMYRWLLVEHTGTHMDAPFHFSDQTSADEIPISDLVGPLAIVDIRAKAEANADAQLTPDDLRAWEEEHGRLPDGGIVAMYSGWDAHVRTDRFRNADDQGVMHFPGWHIEAIDFLLAERNIKGILVDTLSLDYGPSADFAVHYRWLPSNRWGMEGVANLGELPLVGATLIAASPKIAGATGGPSRVIALV
jgi:kynurenine formamidase